MLQLLASALARDVPIPLALAVLRAWCSSRTLVNHFVDTEMEKLSILLKSSGVEIEVPNSLNRARVVLSFEMGSVSNSSTTSTWS